MPSYSATLATTKKQMIPIFNNMPTEDTFHIPLQAPVQQSITHCEL
jgi:hypothetical protein